MADLDYVTVVGRLGITRVDGADADDNPDTVWCDEGQVIFTPVIGEAHIAEGDPVPWMVGNSPISANVDKNGYISLNGVKSISLVDLGSDKINPRVDRGKGSYKVTFKGVKCEGTPVNFTGFSCHPLPASLLPGDKTTNDLTIMAPVPAAGGQPIVQGRPGVSVTDAIINAGNLVLTMSDGSTIDAGAVGGGGGASLPSQSGNSGKVLTTDGDSPSWSGLAWGNVTGKPSTFPPQVGTSSVTAKAGNYTPTWGEITGKPSLFSGNYSDLTGKPSLFSGSYSDLTDKPASTPTAWGDVTGKPNTFPPAIGTTASTALAGNTAYVPPTRKVAGKALTDDVTLTASDVGALPVESGVTARFRGFLTAEPGDPQEGDFFFLLGS